MNPGIKGQGPLNSNFSSTFSSNFSTLSPQKNATKYSSASVPVSVSQQNKNTDSTNTEIDDNINIEIPSKNVIKNKSKSKTHFLAVHFLLLSFGLPVQCRAHTNRDEEYSEEEEEYSFKFLESLLDSTFDRYVYLYL